MSTRDHADPYQLDPQHVIEPPQTVLAILRRIGPGLVLSASIVGSGELIATTTLGAKVGYSMMWLIIFSCLIKAVVQAMLGRYIIATGETTLVAFARVPGPRARANWVAWAWVVTALMTQFALSAMYIGVSQVMHEIVPAVPSTLWIVALALLTLVLLLRGAYSRIERIATFKVAVFTAITCMSALLMTRLPEYFSWSEIARGLVPAMPARDELAIALAVFGVTGVAAGELCVYPYWCIEKGYARFTGPRDGSPAWRRRARGWIRVMQVDVSVSLVIYTLATIAFYMLGAGILHRTGQVPGGTKMVAALSGMYTQTLGAWTLWLFYALVVVILYGTIFAITAGQSRVLADFAQILGGFARDDQRRRNWFRDVFIVLVSVVAVVFVLVFGHTPVTFLTLAGIAQAALLVILAFSTLYLATVHMPEEARPSRASRWLLWLACVVISAFVLPALYLELRRLF